MNSECPIPQAAAAPLKAYSVGDSVPPGVLRLHLNEFRYPHAPDVLMALSAGVSAPGADQRLLTEYQAGPDPRLLDELARYVGLPPGEASRGSILLAPGSDEILRAIIDTSELRGHRTVIMGTPGYTHFEHFARLRGLEVRTYAIGLQTPPWEHESSLRYHDDAMAAGCLVYLCSPNNPTGDLWRWEAIDRLSAQYPRSLFLLDEAYIEFASADAGEGLEPPARCGDPLNRCSVTPDSVARPNVIVTRTMSKAFGLAAMRVGYAVGHPDLIRSVGLAVSPKAFWPLATDVAIAALRAAPHYLAAARQARAEARRVVSALSRAGWWALDSPANFYLVWVGDTAAAVSRLRLSGVQIRDRHSLPGLAGFVRLTAGCEADSEAVLAAFRGLAPPLVTPPQQIYTPKGRVAEIKSLLRSVLGVCRGAGVPVWAHGGTLLGAVRHRGMIPTDDDADLAYERPEAGPDPLGGLVPVFRAVGLTLQRNRTDAYWQVGTNFPGDPISDAHVDIFSCRRGVEPDGSVRIRVEDPRFAQEDPLCGQAHCNTSYSPEELWPLRTLPFYDLAIDVPARCEGALARALGPDYMTVARARCPASGPLAFALEDPSPA